MVLVIIKAPMPLYFTLIVTLIGSLMVLRPHKASIFNLTLNPKPLNPKPFIKPGLVCTPLRPLAAAGVVDEDTLVDNVSASDMWVVVKIMVPFWVPIIIRHLLLSGTQKGTLILTTTHV